MQIQGTIGSIVPDGGYQSQNGWIYKFNMTINTQQGPVIGEIGSKSEQYPMQQGDQITVNSSNDGRGTKFKKVNQGYDNQQPQQSQQQAPPPQQRPQQNNVQDDIRFAQSVNLAVSEYVNGKIEETQIQERVKIWYTTLKTRNFVFTMGMSGPQQDDPPKQEPQQPAPQQEPQQERPQYGTSELDDNIPF